MNALRPAHAYALLASACAGLPRLRASSHGNAEQPSSARACQCTGVGLAGTLVVVVVVLVAVCVCVCVCARVRVCVRACVFVQADVTVRTTGQTALPPTARI